MDYATTHQYFDAFVAEGILSNDIHEDSRKWAFERAIKMEIHRQLIWSICQMTQVLCLPLTDIERYMDRIHQLSSLSEVLLSSANIVWSSDFLYTNDSPEGRNQRNKKQEELRDRFFKGMIQFVQQHTSIHKNVLRSAHVPYFHGTHQHSPVDVHFEILGLLPPLLNPRSIETSNWFQIVARLNDTNLSFVESIDLVIDLGNDQAGKISKLLSKQPPSFLSRCRTLRKLAMRTLGPDTFHWAVLEKKQKDEAQKQESAMGQNLQHGYHHHQSAFVPLVPLIPLVPLRAIEIINSKSLVMLQELSDIGFAFGDSLEELSVSDWWYTQGPQLTELTTNTSQPIHGQGWDLPRLRTLCFGVNNYQLHFDMDALERCCALESLSLHDTTMTLHYQDIRSWSPVRLPHLKKLTLAGSPAIRFNLESLRHSSSLEELSLQIEALDDHSHHKPSPEGLECEASPGSRQITESHEPSGESGTMVQRYSSAQFTWDWHLPKLSSLYLRAVFALTFDFQWLQLLSNLQRLHLDIGSLVERSARERHIALGELSKCQQKRQQLDENRSGEVLSDLYFSLPKLESMTLDGRWIFEERVLEVFCLVVAPNLHQVDLGEGCSGYTLQEWILLARRMSHVECVALGLPLTDDEIREAGLMPEQELRDEQRNKKRIDYMFWQGTFFDLLES